MNKIDPGLKKVFDQAFQNHQRGDLKNAEVLYKKILKLKPNHLRTNFFLGTLFIQRKRRSLNQRKLQLLSQKQLMSKQNYRSIKKCWMKV